MPCSSSLHPSRHSVGQCDRALVLDYLAQNGNTGSSHPVCDLTCADFDRAVQGLIDDGHAVSGWPTYRVELTETGRAAHVASCDVLAALDVPPSVVSPAPLPPLGPALLRRRGVFGPHGG